MVPINARPILWHITKIYAARGFKSFVFCLGCKCELIMNFIPKLPLEYLRRHAFPRPRSNRSILRASR
jgi:NDP-sugar pyrophosphorylase family protein